MFCVNLNVCRPDIRLWGACRVRCCITKAESGLVRVREEPMCWMGFTSGSKTHLPRPFLRPGPLVLCPSLSLVKTHTHWPSVLILFACLPHHVCCCSLLHLVLLFHAVYSPKQISWFICCGLIHRWMGSINCQLWFVHFILSRPAF